MTLLSGTFQFFYCTRELANLPHPDVPTRDVTDTHRRGNKTEPFLERRTENWCPCRALFITAAARRGQEITARGGTDYLLLTTRHPSDRSAFVVGLMPFSQTEFQKLKKKFPTRWSDYSPYVSDRGLKLASFSEAFSLCFWMQREKLRTIPGGQGGRGLAAQDVLQAVVKHFESCQDRSAEFVENVKWLEKQLQHSKPKQWEDYANRVYGSGHGCGSSRRKNRRCR